MQTPKSPRHIKPPTWQESVIKALRLLGGKAPLSELYRKVEEVRVSEGLPWTLHAKAKVRQVVQKSGQITPDGTSRSGVWRLKTEEELRQS